MNKIAKERTRIGRKTCKPVGKPSITGSFYTLDYDVKVWVYPQTIVAVDDTITADDLTFRVIEVQILRDRLGNIHHKKLLCQKYV